NDVYGTMEIPLIRRMMLVAVQAIGVWLINKNERQIYIGAVQLDVTWKYERRHGGAMVVFCPELVVSTTPISGHVAQTDNLADSRIVPNIAINPRPGVTRSILRSL